MNEAIRVHRLANGVTVICDPSPAFETIALSVVAGRGARFEDEARRGWSHLLEHMVFKGAGGRSAREIVEAIESRGGHINAATGHERTSFQVRALKADLARALEITADLVLRPTLDEGDLEREKQVVGQEIAEAADTPDDQVFELAQSAAFASQPLGRCVLGTEESIATATSQGLEAWRDGLYAADRLVVSAAGAIDEDELLDLATGFFGDARDGDPPCASPADFVGGSKFERRRLEQAHLVFVLPAPGGLDPDHFALRVFADALGGGMASRLFQECRERLGLAYAIDAFAEGWSDIGMLGVYAGCDPKDAGPLAQVAAREVRDLALKIRPDELARAKAQLEASVFMARESLLARTEMAAGQWLSFGRLLPAAELSERIKSVDASAVANLADRVLASGKSAVAVLGPKAAEETASRFFAALAA